MDQKPCRNFCSVCTCSISCFQTCKDWPTNFNLGKIGTEHLHNHGKFVRSIFFTDSPQTRDTIVNFVNRVRYRGIRLDQTFKGSKVDYFSARISTKQWPG